MEEALYRLVETNMALGIVPEAQTATAVLGHNYPNSEWYKNAFALLKSGGVSPQINQGTWLSKTLKALTPGAPQKKPEPVTPAQAKLPPWPESMAAQGIQLTPLKQWTANTAARHISPAARRSALSAWTASATA